MVKNIGLIGDSIGHGFYDEQNLGWFNRLGQKILAVYPGKYTFNNMAQSGDNIADAVNRAYFEVSSRHFDLILVNVGINDLRRRKDSNLQLDFSEGLRALYWNRLLDILQGTHADVVVADLLPVVENRYTPQASLIRKNADVERYNEIIKEICRQKNVKFFARYEKWQQRSVEDLYKDATHPTAAGHQIIADEFFDYLQQNDLLR